MNFEPLVSVIINNYNYASYLPAAIDSALNQTYPKIEVIIVDDGSTDNSRDIIAGYKTQILALFKENGGQASAFNAGFSCSNGDIICLLDADDVFMPNKVELIVMEFQQNPESEWLIHRMNYIDRTGSPMVLKETTDSFLNESGNYIDSARIGKFKKILPATTALVFKRALIQKILPVPNQLRVTADNYLKFSCLIKSPVIVCSSFLSSQRIHGHNLYTNVPMNSKKRRSIREINYNIAKGLWRIDSRQIWSIHLLFSVFKSSVKDLDIRMMIKSTMHTLKILIDFVLKKPLEERGEEN